MEVIGKKQNRRVYMPELPEVETIRTALESYIVGKNIERVTVSLPRLVKNVSVLTFQQKTQGCTILGIRRRGKYLTLLLSGSVHVMIHLRMTGRLLYMDRLPAMMDHIHIYFRLNKGFLVYHDVRTFGGFWLVPITGMTGIDGYDSLGPDGNSPKFTATYLYRLVQKRKSTIKAVLLDQKVVAGLGNIYVDEALFLAKIRPDEKANVLSLHACKVLHEAINQVLTQGISHGGTTIRDYVNGIGKKGSNQHFLQVYGKEGSPCPRCGHTIQYIKLGGRGTHFCPLCQRRKGR